MTARPPAPNAALLDDLVAANRVLYAKGIVDGLGHVSARHDKDPSMYVLAAERAPALVTRDDLAIYDLDSNALTLTERRGYIERFIHGEIYKARPDVMSVIHCHTPSLVTFCVCQVPLRPVYHMSGFLGAGVGRFEARETFGMTDMLISSPAMGRELAKSLGKRAVVLMRGHGATMAGASIKHTVFRAIYSALNATMQMDAMRMGDVSYLSDEEAAKTAATNDRVVDRSWALWKAEAAGEI
ncbi:MAG: class II aldolase/adducin family protein [Pseudolabrys sp.]|nr:class II aldolase/adducin family protein [Pseudolabrys sp.]